MGGPTKQPVDPRLAKLLAGEPLVFPHRPKNQEEKPEEIADRTIPAKWLEDLAARPERVVRIPIHIENAVIDGKLDLQYATFEYEVEIVKCQFKEPAHLSFALFKRIANFEWSHFLKGASFRGARAEGDFVIMGGIFEDESVFEHLRVAEVLDAHGACFGWVVSFEGMEVGKNAVFSNHPDQRVILGAAQATFRGAHIHGDAEFNGAEFLGNVLFDSMEVDGNVFFCSLDRDRTVTFRSDVRFRGVHIHGNAEFLGVEFQRGAYFGGMQVDGDAFFSTGLGGQHVTFGAQVNFYGVHILGAAVFSEAKFQAEAAFSGMQVVGEVNFHWAEFSGPSTFRDARLGVVCFGTSEPEPGTKRAWFGKTRPGFSRRTRFGGPMNLSGLTCNRIEMSLEDVLKAIAGRESFNQLEDILRKAGDDERANQVYLERRRVERERMFSEGGRWRGAWDWLYWRVANYGIRPYRLLGWALILILVGALMLAQPGALRPKEEKPAAGQASSTSNPPGAIWWRAFAVSVHQFLPIDVPMGADWVPSDRAVPIVIPLGKRQVSVPILPSLYATVFLRIAGTILVGIGFGAATGLLRRAAR